MPGPSSTNVYCVREKEAGTDALGGSLVVFGKPLGKASTSLLEGGKKVGN